jgi:hypothetical protein
MSSVDVASNATPKDDNAATKITPIVRPGKIKTAALAKLHDLCCLLIALSKFDVPIQNPEYSIDESSMIPGGLTVL